MKRICPIEWPASVNVWKDGEVRIEDDENWDVNKFLLVAFSIGS